MSERMLSVDEAEAEVRAHGWNTGSEDVGLDDAAGRILAQDVAAERDQPPFDRVMMDGIAIRHAAWEGGRRLFPLRGTAAAGRPRVALLDPDGCIEVMTGAPMPEGTDCVIPVECLARSGHMAEVGEDADPRPGRYVHPRASDHPAGTVLLEPGIRVGGPEMAVLAAAGLTRVRVARLARAAIVTTGDELVQPGEPVAGHQIRSSNDRAMAAALERRRLAVCERAHFGDDPDAMGRGIEALLERSDVLILSGGVSRGRFDHVPGVLGSLGVKKRFHRVAQRPGKPLWFGSAPGGKPVFALPGNPVSTVTCLARYVVPALERAQGLSSVTPLRACLARQVEFAGPLTLFLPCTLGSDESGRLVATTRAPNTSGDFTSLAGTTGFVELPAAERRYPAGFPARYYAW